MKELTIGNVQITHSLLTSGLDLTTSPSVSSNVHYSLTLVVSCLVSLLCNLLLFWLLLEEEKGSIII